MADVKKRFRLTIPDRDKMAIEWLMAQENVSMSIRQLIHMDCARFGGVGDLMCRMVCNPADDFGQETAGSLEGQQGNAVTVPVKPAEKKIVSKDAAPAPVLAEPAPEPAVVFEKPKANASPVVPVLTPASPPVYQDASFGGGDILSKYF